MTFPMIFSPDSEIELIFLKSWLEEEAIAYFFQGDYFGSWFPGPQIDGYNRRYLCVWPDDYAKAAEIIKVFQNDAPSRSSLRTIDRVFILLEGIVLGWFFPGRRFSPGYYVRTILDSFCHWGAYETNWMFEEGIAAYGRKEFEKAIESFSDYLAHHPTNRDALFYLLHAYTQTERMEEAKETLDQLLASGFRDWNKIRESPDLKLLRSYIESILFSKE